MATTERKIIIKERLEFEKNRLEELQKAYIALVEGGVKSYMIEDRQLSKLDLRALGREIEACEKKIDNYEAILSGRPARKAFGVVPREW